MHFYTVCLLCFITGAIVTLTLTPLVIRLAFKVGAVDRPANRKIHGRVTPRLGGVGLFFGMWTPLILLCFFNNLFILQFLDNDKHLFLLLIGGLSMVLIGIVDDIHGLGSRVKFALQFPVAIILVIGGAKFDSINFPLVGHVALGPLGPFLSILWLVGVTNAVNLIDGVDGLASGVAYLIALAIATLSIYSGQIYLAIVMCSVAGACLGFLRHNFNPARIFMGDGGSYFLGFALAAISIVGPAKGLTGVSLLLPLLILSLPLADMSAVIMGRLSEGRSPFYPDRRHLHHRLLRAGFSHRRTVVLIYAFTQWLAALALVVADAELRFLWLGLATAVLIAVVVVFRRQMQQEAG
jgi:UDP-N-acetylmuramyl pentapeptide phosphotransferase/UDP-N-acetylglucosamine-1-phosphate transferase